MGNETTTINLAGVNCYLVKGDDGYILIDTGFFFRRKAIDGVIEKAGCKAGDLKLIIITHGDTDHAGNAVYFRDKHGAKIAMHREETAATEKGSLRFNRKLDKRSARTLMAILLFSLPFAGLTKSARFKPDVYVEDGDDFTGYGFKAKALHVPGHTKGSVAILTEDGDLFCGDLLKSNGKAEKNNLIDDEAEMDESIERLKGMDIRKVYPGHGKAFKMEELVL